jgi:hypothetical protein
MRYTFTVAILIHIALSGGCIPGDNERPDMPPSDAGVSEVRVCNTGAEVACSIDGLTIPCGATEVEVAPLLAGACTYTGAPACDDLACEWTVDCDVGGCTCVVGYPAGRLTACTY